MQAMNWDDLRHLLAIARAGTLAGAARRLAVNQTTVARRLAALEAALGVRLFARAEGRLHPTKAGELALARAAEVEQEIEGLARGIAGTDRKPAGLVRLTAVPILVNRLLVPALPALSARHPRIRLELIAESRNLSLTRREADLALRLARPESGAGLLTRRLGDLDYAVYGPRGKAGDRLAWITYEEGLGHLPQARWIARQAGAALAPRRQRVVLRLARRKDDGRRRGRWNYLQSRYDGRTVSDLPTPACLFTRPFFLRRKRRRPEIPDHH